MREARPPTTNRVATATLGCGDVRMAYDVNTQRTINESRKRMERMRREADARRQEAERQRKNAAADSKRRFEQQQREQKKEAERQRQDRERKDVEFRRRSKQLQDEADQRRRDHENKQRYERERRDRERRHKDLLRSRELDRAVAQLGREPAAPAYTEMRPAAYKLPDDVRRSDTRDAPANLYRPRRRWRRWLVLLVLAVAAYHYREALIRLSDRAAQDSAVVTAPAALAAKPTHAAAHRAKHKAPYYPPCSATVTDHCQQGH